MISMGANLPDIKTLLQAGIDPKTKLPIKMVSIDCSGDVNLEMPIRQALEIMDRQDAVKRYIWHNLPSGLTGEMMERILYFKGQGIFFYKEENEKFYFLPYALSGNIDVYGRFLGVTPLPFGGPTSTEEKNGKTKPWIKGLELIPVYDIIEAFDNDGNLNIKNKCVILKDYVPGISETIIPRQQIQYPVLQGMAEAFPFARTALIANSGVKGMRVQDQNDYSNVEAASRSVTHAAKVGRPWIPILGQIDFQDLTSAGSALKSEEYLIYLQALDNFRLSLYGLKNGGLFQKKSHMLEAEQEMNDGNINLTYQDGLTLRQDFCEKVNIMYGLGIWCEANESVVGLDRNGDAVIGDNKDTINNETINEHDGGGEENV